MIRHLLTAGLPTLLLTCSLAAGEWRSDYQTAKAEAAEQQLPLLVHFYAPWCGPCMEMERGVLHQPALTGRFGRDFVAVKLNFDDNKPVAKSFGIKSLPADVLLTPEGGVLWHSEQSYGLGEYQVLLTSATARHRPQPKVEFARAEPQPEAVSPDVPQPVEPAAPVENLGLDGYNPVALFHQRSWTPGSPEFAYEYGGFVYYMSSREELDEFRERPYQYAPQLRQYDPVLLSRQEETVPGQVGFAAYYDNALYLFSSEETRREFKAEPQRFVRSRHALLLDEIHGTRMR